MALRVQLDILQARHLKMRHKSFLHILHAVPQTQMAPTGCAQTGLAACMQAVQRRARELLEDPSPDLGGEATTKEQSGQALTTFGVRCAAAGPL